MFLPPFRVGSVAGGCWTIDRQISAVQFWMEKKWNGRPTLSGCARRSVRGVLHQSCSDHAEDMVVGCHHLMLPGPRPPGDADFDDVCSRIAEVRQQGLR